jgi:tetratricopeptide (TPR) repeat protein
MIDKDSAFDIEIHPEHLFDKFSLPHKCSCFKKFLSRVHSQNVCSFISILVFFDRINPLHLIHYPYLPCKKEQAQDLIYQAFDHPSPEARVELSKKALKLDPNQTDAYVLLGEEATTYEQAIEYFLQGLQAAEREFGQAFFKENTGAFWGLIETRPYMRAKAGYADCLWGLGKKKEAIYQYQQMLTLNPNDNQGMRYILLQSYIDQKDYAKAKQLVTQYPEHTANIAFNQVLIEFGKHGSSSKIHYLVKKAHESNPHVTDYLLGKKKLTTPELVNVLKKLK